MNIGLQYRPSIREYKDTVFLILSENQIKSKGDLLNPKVYIRNELFKNIFIYYECNRPKRDLQNNILQVYIII